LQDGVGACRGNRFVKLAVGVAGQRDQAHIGVVLTEPSDRRDAVHERHVQVDDDRVRVKLVRALDRVETVPRSRDDGQLGLMLDQRPQGLEESLVVVRQEDADGCRSHPFQLVLQGRDVSLAAVSAQPPERQVVLIGAPLDLGAGRRGVDMGPSAIRYAGIAEHLAEKLDIETSDLGNIEAPVAESTVEGDDQARYLPQILELCDRVAKLVAQVRREGKTPIVLGGDHSVALGSLVGMASVSGPGGVIWVDAHGDLNTPESSPSGNAWGMPLRMLIDAGDVASEDVTLLGARSLDPPEEAFIAAAGIRRELGELPPNVYVALDCDVVEPAELDVWMPEPGGIPLGELEALLAGIPRPIGAGFTGLKASSRNEEALPRLGHALGL
jgi:arginase family enzyme